MTAMVAGIAVATGCSVTWTPSDDGGGLPGNRTDPTNGGASYVGSAACAACHADVAARHALHGHARILSRIEGLPPAFPETASRVGVPAPPDGYDWTDVAYVIGGYTKKANFIDKFGFVIPSGSTDAPAQWNLAFPPTGSAAGFANVEGGASEPAEYAYDCFRCHVTGAAAGAEDTPPHQDNRPGILGTWAEAGVQCESCHGPGSRHFTADGQDVQVLPSAIFVSSQPSATCGSCHSRTDDAARLEGDEGFVASYQQYSELLASGGHASFGCATCHDPHVSVAYDRTNAFRNACTDCHADQNMGKHAGKVFTRGDYTEVLTCESCHMPFAGKSASSATAEVVGELGRMGDTRTHIFRIDSSSVTYTDMFTEDLAEVRTDAAGRAAVTLDFVCLRCHNGIGAFDIEPRFLTDIAANMHFISEP